MFKNWKVIRGILDTHFMWAIALLDLATDFGQMVASRFPEYFTDQEQHGPIPLSVLRMEAARRARKEDGSYCDLLITWGAEMVFPVFEFETDTEGCSQQWECPVIPAEIEKQIKQLGRRADVGDIFTWEGKSIVCLENNDGERGGCYLIYFAPAECIALDR